MAEAQDLKHLLLETNEEYRQLATKHHELDDRLHELTSKHYLSDTEQFEEVTLKKRKLQLKDQMELIARIYRTTIPGRDRHLSVRRLESLQRAEAVARCARLRSLSVRTRDARPRPARRRRALRPAMIGRSMGIDRAGWPFILGALVVGARRWLVARPIVGSAVSRPRRLLSSSSSAIRTVTSRPVPDLVVSPADGRVMIVGPSGPGAPPGDWQQISIFLSPMDVHVNRAPVDGDGHARRLSSRASSCPAYREEAGQLNEWTEVWFDHDGHAGRVPSDCRHPRAPHRDPPRPSASTSPAGNASGS